MECDAHWLEALAARGRRPPRRPRALLSWLGMPIGSVEPEMLSDLGLPGILHDRGNGWEVLGELTPALAQVAFALRAAGRVHAWRDEQLAVTTDEGRVLGTVERGVTRILGIATQAVHLLGVDPAGESVEGALARETQEEAGLELGQLRDVQPGGTVTTQRPSATVPAGYIVERLAWYRCVMPRGVVPVNRDGEVAEFRRMPPAEVARRLQADEFTVDAALTLVQRGL